MPAKIKKLVTEKTPAVSTSPDERPKKAAPKSAAQAAKPGDR